jgi:hypothetical protein
MSDPRSNVLFSGSACDSFISQNGFFAFCDSCGFHRNAHKLGPNTLRTPEGLATLGIGSQTTPAAQPDQLSNGDCERCGQKIGRLCQHIVWFDENGEKHKRHAIDCTAPVRNESESVVPTCGQGERDRNILGALSPTIIYYGPHPCENCARIICRTSRNDGHKQYRGLAFDYPDEPIYPNTNWVEHVCHIKATKPPKVTNRMAHEEAAEEGR